MEVAVVVLLELDGLKLEPSERLGIRQLLDYFVKLVVFVRRGLVGVRVGVVFARLNLYCRVRLEIWNNHVVQDLDVVLL